MTQDAAEPPRQAANDGAPSVVRSGSNNSGRVPVGETIKYRRRAQQAEERLEQFQQQAKDLQTRLEQREKDLGLSEAQRDEARHQLVAVENRSRAERMLGEAGVVDIEAASLLLSKRVDFGEELDGEAITRRVEQLLLDKPYLRGGPSGTLPPKTASARSAPAGGIAQLTRAADRALASGDRRDVAEYLRLRRQASKIAKV